MTETHQKSAGTQGAGGFASANSTSTLFLGSQPKTWMQSGGASPPIQQQPLKASKPQVSVTQRQGPREQPNASAWQTARVATATASGPSQGRSTRPSDDPPSSTVQISPPSTQPAPASRPPSPAPSETANVSSPDISQPTHEPLQRSHTSAEVMSPSNSRPPLPNPIIQQQSLASPPYVPPVPSPTGTMALNGNRLHKIADSARSRDGQSNFDMLRIRFLMEACETDDEDAIILHQLYMIWTVDSTFLTTALQFDKASLDGMLVLSYVLGRNDALTPSLAQALCNFPEPWTILTRTVRQRLVNNLKMSLLLIGAHWDAVIQSCSARGYPLSPTEISVTFALASTRMQLAIFIALSRHMHILEGHGGGYDSVLIARFLFFQQRRHTNPVPPNVERDEWRSHFQQFITNGSQPQQTMMSPSMSPGHNPHQQLPPGHATGQAQRPHTPEHPGRRLVPAAQTRFAIPSQRLPPQANRASPQRGQGAFPNNAIQSTAPRQPQPQMRQIQQVKAQQRQLRFQQRQPQQGQLRQPAPVMTHIQQHQDSAPYTLPAQLRLPAYAQQYPQYSDAPGGHHSSDPRAGPISTPQLMQGSFQVNQFAPQGYSNDQGQMVSAHPGIPLLPAPNWMMPQAVAPNPDRVALHQAHVRSPVARTVDLADKPNPDLCLYQVVTNLVLSPQALGPDPRYATFQLEISGEESDRKVAHTPPPHTSLTTDSNVFKQGSLRWRFKCIARNPKDPAPPEESDFCASSTSWPEHLFVSFNQLDDLTLRRKSHYGRDLPADLTVAAIAGSNTLAFSFDLSAREKTLKKSYYIAIERVEVFEHTQLLQSIPTMPSSDSLTRILDSMKGGNSIDDDDDVAITNPTIWIDVTDPFSARLWKTPVRGKSCKHRECFDLDNFMSSRRQLRTQLAGPSGADDWKCPHCQRDARPQQLIVDGFLQDVKDSLAQTGRLNVKAILVKQDGTWEAKIEDDDESGGQPRAQSATPARNADGGDAVGGSASTEAAVEVVSIDDDD